MKPPRKGRLGWVLAGVTSLLFGCVAPADLANPQDFSPLVGGDIDPCVTRAIRNAKCSIDGCHGNIMPASNLVLTGNLASLKDKPAAHIVTPPAMGPPVMCPTGDKLIDSANPANSWMLKKITGMDGDCGDAMPVGFTMTEDDRQCLVTWINSFGSGAGGSGGAASGGAGGTSGGSGGGAGAAAGGSAGAAAGAAGGGAGGTGGGTGGGGTGGTG